MGGEHEIRHNEASVVYAGKAALFVKDDENDGCAVEGIDAGAHYRGVVARELVADFFVGDCENYRFLTVHSAGGVETCLDYLVDYLGGGYSVGV